MHGLVVKVAADAAAEVLLLVEHVVLDAGDDARALRAQNRLRHRHPAQERVWPEGLEVSSACRVSSEWAHDGAEVDV